MPGVKLEQFGGQLPAWDPHLLPTGQASASINGYLFGGNLIGWRKPKVLHTLLNSAARAAYRIPTVQQTQAKAFLAFTSQPLVGDTATVGDLTYTFVLTLAKPNDVLIGGSVAATALHFIQAITADDATNTNAGINYGNNTVANGDIYFTVPGTDAPGGLSDPATGFNGFQWASVGAFSFGAAYNNLPVNTTGTSLIWLSDTLSLAHTTATLTGGTNPVFDSSITSSSLWLEFNDPDTDVVKSPVVNDQWNRFYFASPSDVPKYNTYDRIAKGLNPWYLGVPPPGCAPITSVTGGGNSLTLGSLSTSGQDRPISANTVYLIPIVPTGSTSIIDIQWILSTNGVSDINATPTTHWAGVIYDDDQSSGFINVPGKPLNLLNSTPTITGVSSANNNIATFTNPTGLNGNTPYWIGIIIDTSNTALGNASANVTSFTATFSNGPPGTAPTNPTQGQAGIQMWADCLTSDVLEARSYVYTWVTEYGEEGPPSPPTVLTGWSNGVWTVGLWLPPIDDLGIVRNFKTVNLYRTVPSSGGSTDFFYVATISIADLNTAFPVNPNVQNGNYIDKISNAVVALNDKIPSADWFPPPTNMQGLLAMQNGVVAGFIGNEIWFCDPYHPHAWPPGNVLTVDQPIVGIGLTAGTLVVCTAANPYTITGTIPGGSGNMTMQKGALPNPCISKGSILSGDAAVTYMSPNGLIQVNSTGVALNTTDLWFTRDKWRSLVPQKYVHAIYMASSYYAFGTVSPPTISPVDNSLAQAGFTVQLDNDVQSFTIWPQPGGHRVGYQKLTSPTGFDLNNVMMDVWSGTGLCISNGAVWYFDFSDPAPTLQTYDWTSKTYQQNVKRQFSAMKVFFDIPASAAPQNITRLTLAASDPTWLAPLPIDRYGYILTYVDVDGTGMLTLIDAREIRQSGELLRVVDGFKAEQWRWRIVGRVNISNVQIATSPKELGTV